MKEAQELQRADILVQQRRPKEAMSVLQNFLAHNPDNTQALCTLAYCHILTGDHDSAYPIAQHACGLSPENPMTHYMLGLCHLKADRFNEALDCAEVAIRMAPEWTDAYTLKAQVQVRLEKMENALASVNEGLKFDAEDQHALNVRSMILTNLRQHDAAKSGLEANLAIDPHNALAHANMGWSHLHKGDHKKSEEFFREALRLDPGMEYARRGMIEAIKSKNAVFRGMLRALLWLGTFDSRTQFFIIIGGFIGMRALRGLPETMPETAPLVQVFMALYLLFIFVTWAWRPLTNCVLLLHPFGRLVLNPLEKAASLLMWVFILGAAATYAYSYTSLESQRFAYLGVVLLFVAIPIGVTSEIEDKKYRFAAGGYSLLMLGLGLGGFAIEPPLGTNFILAHFVCLIIWFWGLGHVLAKR